MQEHSLHFPPPHPSMAIAQGQAQREQVKKLISQFLHGRRPTIYFPSCFPRVLLPNRFHSGADYDPLLWDIVNYCEPLRTKKATWTATKNWETTKSSDTVKQLDSFYAQDCFSKLGEVTLFSNVQKPTPRLKGNVWIEENIPNSGTSKNYRKRP